MAPSRSSVRWRGRPRAVVLFSGGLDSTVTLAKAIEDGCECYPLLFDYGQSNCIEVDRAIALLSERSWEHTRELKVVDLTYRHIAPDCAMLNGGKGDFGNTEDITVPNRFMVFMSLAGAYASSLSARYVYTGLQTEQPLGEGWAGTYDGGNGQLVDDMETMLQHYSGVRHRKVFIRTPLLTMGKAQIVKEAERFGIKREQTYSCLKGTVPTCGACVSCTQFRLAVSYSSTRA